MEAADQIKLLELSRNLMPQKNIFQTFRNKIIPENRAISALELSKMTFYK